MRTRTVVKASLLLLLWLATPAPVSGYYAFLMIYQNFSLCYVFGEAITVLYFGEAYAYDYATGMWLPSYDPYARVALQDALDKGHGSIEHVGLLNETPADAYVETLSVEYWRRGEWLATSLHGMVPYVWGGDPAGLWALQVSMHCGCCDERDAISTEYILYNVNWLPDCSDYTLQGGEPNTGDYSFSIVRSVLPGAVSSWRSLYGQPLTVSSAYRNPARNRSVGGKPNSRHMYGDACDMANPDRTEATWWAIYRAVRRVTPLPSYVEDIEDSGVGHVHADWH